MSEIARHMGAVARHLLGEPNVALSRKSELRYGSNGSLSIDLAKGIWSDHEAKTGGGVLDLIARETKLQNGAAIEWMKEKLGIDLGSNARQEVASYPYTDENGKLLYEVVRFAPKDFRQRRPDGNGGWIWNLKGVSPVPFRLSELMLHTVSDVFIVEGEKDVIALEKMGLVATCNSGGAGKWPRGFGQYFKDRNIVIIPDNDEAGEKHSLDVARDLAPAAESIHILRLPNLPSKGDVSDWIAAGGIFEELLHLAIRAPKYDPAAASPAIQDFQGEPKDEAVEPELVLDRVSEWDGLPLLLRDWGVLDRIPSRNVSLFSGEGGLGKTLLLQQLGVAGVAQRAWLGVVPKPGPFIGLFCEDERDELHRRFEAIADYYGVSLASLTDLHVKSLAGADAILAAPDRAGIVQPTDLYHRLLQASERIRPSIIGLDTSADMFAGNENDRAQVRQFVTLLRRLALASGAAVILTSHPSLTGAASGSGLSGSTAWNGSVRSRLYLKRPKADGDGKPDGDERILEVMKSNYGPTGETVAIKWERGVFVQIGGGVHWLDKRAVENGIDELFLLLLDRFETQGRNVSNIRTSPGYAPTAFASDPEATEKRINRQAFEGAMARLFAEGKIRVETYGRPARPSSKLVRKVAG